MMSPVVASLLRIKVVPIGVIRWHTHFLRVSMIQTVATTVVFLSPVVLWVVHIGIVIKPIPVVMAVSTAPGSTVCSLLCLSF